MEYAFNMGQGVNIVGPYQSGWHHYAGVFDGTTFVVDVDGAPAGEDDSGPPDYSVDDMTVGCQIDFGNEVIYLTGAIDDVRFYARALAADEVSPLATP
jgi:hypothetical protein